MNDQQPMTTIDTASPSDAPVSLVVGGSSGIGAAVVQRLATAGYRVVVAGSRTEASATATTGWEPSALYLQADMSEPSAPAKLVAQIAERFGRLDHVVYSAGATERIPHANLGAADDAVWDRILAMNLRAPWRLVVAAEALLRAGANSSVTFVGALAGVDVGGSSIPYAVSKAALHHLAKLLGAVLGPEIRVNAVAPGLIDTPWVEGDAFRPILERVEASAPARRVGTAADVADLIVSLMSNGYVTGQTVVIDGGLSLLV